AQTGDAARGFIERNACRIPDSPANFILTLRADCTPRDGEGLIFLRFDPAGEILGYSEFDIWPQWGAGDLGGALRADQHGKRAGVAGAKRTFSWMFDTLKLERIVATGALDNVRTARMMDGLGLERKGQITSTRPDGSSRRSLVWEIERGDWHQRQASES
ncbi:MAG: GNAT family protein, partial [Pseudomonadota bacterium]